MSGALHSLCLLLCKEGIQSKQATKANEAKQDHIQPRRLQPTEISNIVKTHTKDRRKYLQARYLPGTKRTLQQKPHSPIKKQVKDLIRVISEKQKQTKTMANKQVEKHSMSLAMKEMHQNSS